MKTIEQTIQAVLDANCSGTYADAEKAIQDYVDQQRSSYQNRVSEWVIECFGLDIAKDIPERNHRFLEESLELVQSTGCTKEDAIKLVDYVYGRPWGEPSQEVGGVMVTLAALCNALQLNMTVNGETELSRVWTKIDKIREKQALKPKFSPLPTQS